VRAIDRASCVSLKGFSSTSEPWLSFERWPYRHSRRYEGCRRALNFLNRRYAASFTQVGIDDHEAGLKRAAAATASVSVAAMSQPRIPSFDHLGGSRAIIASSSIIKTLIDGIELSRL